MTRRFIAKYSRVLTFPSMNLNLGFPSATLPIIEFSPWLDLSSRGDGPIICLVVSVSLKVTVCNQTFIVFKSFKVLMSFEKYFCPHIMGKSL